MKTHPVAKELARLKQYFEKIKMAEGLGAEQAPRTQALDKQAAIRFIKAGLVWPSSYEPTTHSANLSCRLTTPTSAPS